MPWYKQSGEFQLGPPSTTSFDGSLLAATRFAVAQAGQKA
jgi:hypothetical protein